MIDLQSVTRHSRHFHEHFALMFLLSTIYNMIFTFRKLLNGRQPLLLVTAIVLLSYAGVLQTMPHHFQFQDIHCVQVRDLVVYLPQQG